MLYRRVQKIWDSGVGLSSWLLELGKETTNSSKLKDALFSFGPRNILELGKCVPAFSFYLSLKIYWTRRRRNGNCRPYTGCHSIEQKLDFGKQWRSDNNHRSWSVNSNLLPLAKSHASTIESAMPLLEHNISINSDLFLNVAPEALVLDWDEEALPDYIQAFPEGFDVIM
jgi:hypothetical protein